MSTKTATWYGKITILHLCLSLHWTSPVSTPQFPWFFLFQNSILALRSSKYALIDNIPRIDGMLFLDMDHIYNIFDITTHSLLARLTAYWQALYLILAANNWIFGVKLKAHNIFQKCWSLPCSNVDGIFLGSDIARALIRIQSNFVVKYHIYPSWFQVISPLLYSKIFCYPNLQQSLPSPFSSFHLLNFVINWSSVTSHHSSPLSSSPWFNFHHQSSPLFSHRINNKYKTFNNAN